MAIQSDADDNFLEQIEQTLRISCKGVRSDDDKREIVKRKSLCQMKRKKSMDNTKPLPVDKLKHVQDDRLEIAIKCEDLRYDSIESVDARLDGKRLIWARIAT